VRDQEGLDVGGVEGEENHDKGGKDQEADDEDGPRKERPARGGGEPHSASNAPARRAGRSSAVTLHDDSATVRTTPYARGEDVDVGANMTVRASWRGTVLATSDRTLLVEGNHYFPIEDVDDSHLEKSAHSTFCPWKGDASYYDVVVGDERNDHAAWYYAEPYAPAAEVKDRMAFWRGVEVTGSNLDQPELHPPARS
jgi:uncharacterized protein (DUF427 family)